MTEISFLLSLVLDYKLSKQVKDLIKDRIKEIEHKPIVNITQQYQAVGNQAVGQTKPVDQRGQTQSPSMARAIAEMEAEKNQAVGNQAVGGQPASGSLNQPMSPDVVLAAIPQAPVQQGNLIASPAAAQAMNDRMKMINQSIEKGVGNFKLGLPKT